MTRVLIFTTQEIFNQIRREVIHTYPMLSPETQTRFSYICEDDVICVNKGTLDTCCVRGLNRYCYDIAIIDKDLLDYNPVKLEDTQQYLDYLGVPSVIYHKYDIMEVLSNVSYLTDTINPLKPKEACNVKVGDIIKHIILKNGGKNFGRKKEESKARETSC